MVRPVKREKGLNYNEINSPPAATTELSY